MKSVNECAQCGANLFEPEWSEHLPDHRIRNVWSCEACGYQFEDTVYWSARELAAADYGLSKFKFSVTAAQSTDLPSPHCHGSMRLVRHLVLKEMPEIYLFYCSRCQHVETVKQERAA